MSRTYDCRLCGEQKHYNEEMTICPSCAEKKIASLQARLDLFADTIKEERARHDARGRGGQQAGIDSPLMTPGMLKDLERLLTEEQGKYTYEYFLEMSDQIRELVAEVAALRAGRKEE